MKQNNEFLSFTKTAIAITAVAGLVTAAFIEFSPTNTIFKKQAFNKKLWLQDTQAGQLNNPLDCQRGKMVQDLINQQLTPSLTKQDVADLLGDAQPLGKDSIEYPIGWCGYNADNSLYIEFDGEHLRKAYLLKR